MRLHPSLLAAALLLPLAPFAARAQAPGNQAPGNQAPGNPAPGKAAAPSPGPAAAQPPAADDPVVARVDSHEIRMSDVLATAQDVLPAEMRQTPPAMLLQMIPPEAQRQLIERTVTERALTDAARSAGLDKDADVRRRMQRASDQELQQSFLARAVATSVTDSTLRARYEQESGKRQGEEEVHARHILLKTESEAKAALSAVKGGEDFAAVARRLSTDPGSRDGGDLGFFKRSDMVPEFAEAAFAMKPGEVSAAPVQSPFGWHVIKVEARRTAPVPSFEESRQQLRQQMLQEQVDKVVQQVRANAKVEIPGQAAPGAGGSLLDQAAPPAAGGARPAPQRR